MKQLLKYAQKYALQRLKYIKHNLKLVNLKQIELRLTDKDRIWASDRENITVKDANTDTNIDIQSDSVRSLTGITTDTARSHMDTDSNSVTRSILEAETITKELSNTTFSSDTAHLMSLTTDRDPRPTSRCPLRNDHSQPCFPNHIHPSHNDNIVQDFRIYLSTSYCSSRVTSWQHCSLSDTYVKHV